jgi:uncharacterized protein (DUF58 family)
MFDRDGGVFLGLVLVLAFLLDLVLFLVFLALFGLFLLFLTLFVFLFFVFRPVVVQKSSQVRQRFATGWLHFCVTCHVVYLVG